MNLVDSSAWLEYFADGPNARHFAPIVKTAEQLLVPTVILYEVCKVVLRESEVNAALQACAAMQKGLVVALDAKLAVAASKLSLLHALPMADAVILATAREHGATLWTQDAHFKELAGVKYFSKKRRDYNKPSETIPARSRTRVPERLKGAVESDGGGKKTACLAPRDGRQHLPNAQPSSGIQPLRP